jgi:hypothetical protein
VTTVPAVVTAVRDALDGAGIPHAFGGAIALAYGVREPRGTVDVDVNVFVDAAEAARVFAVLPEGVVWGGADVERAVRDGQVRVFWDDVALDLFFDYHPFHRLAAANALSVPFDGGEIRILAPDDLAVFKAFFNRSKDWVDIEALVEAGSVDADVVLSSLVQLLGEDDDRVGHLRQLVAEVAARPADEPVRRLPGPG